MKTVLCVITHSYTSFVRRHVENASKKERESGWKKDKRNAFFPSSDAVIYTWTLIFTCSRHFCLFIFVGDRCRTAVSVPAQHEKRCDSRANALFYCTQNKLSYGIFNSTGAPPLNSTPKYFWEVPKNSLFSHADSKKIALYNTALWTETRKLRKHLSGSNYTFATKN